MGKFVGGEEGVILGFSDVVGACDIEGSMLGIAETVGAGVGSGSAKDR